MLVLAWFETTPRSFVIAARSHGGVYGRVRRCERFVSNNGRRSWGRRSSKRNRLRSDRRSRSHGRWHGREPGIVSMLDCPCLQCLYQRRQRRMSSTFAAAVTCGLQASTLVLFSLHELFVTRSRRLWDTFRRRRIDRL